MTEETAQALIEVLRALTIAISQLTGTGAAGGGRGVWTTIP